MNWNSRLTGICVFIAMVFYMLLPARILAFEFKSPTLKLTVKETDSARIDETGSNSTVSAFYSGVSFKLSAAKKRTSNLEFEIALSQTDYDWSETDNIKFSKGRKPWDSLQTEMISAIYFRHYDNDWSSMTGIMVSNGWEERAYDSFSTGCLLAGIKRITPKSSVLIGISVFKKPGDFTIFPLIGFSYNKRGPGWSASFGMPETEIRYSFNDHFSLYSAFNYQDKIFRLKDDSNLYPSGLVAMRGLTGGFFAELKLAEYQVINLGFLYKTMNNWKIQKENGDTITDVDIEDSTGIELELKFLF